MMAYATGQERKRKHYQALLEAAGLRLDRVIPRPHSTDPQVTPSALRPVTIESLQLLKSGTL
jgi:hypothetical protein